VTMNRHERRKQASVSRHAEAQLAQLERVYRAWTTQRNADLEQHIRAAMDRRRFEQAQAEEAERWVRENPEEAAAYRAKYGREEPSK